VPGFEATGRTINRHAIAFAVLGANTGVVPALHTVFLCRAESLTLILPWLDVPLFVEKNR
jgi:hypothetical protein